MKKILVLALLLISYNLFSQSDSSFITTNINHDIYTMDFATAKAKIQNFIASNNVNITNQREGKISLDVDFYATKDLYQKYEALITSLGYTSYKKIDAVNNYSRIQEINLELTYLKQKRDSYLELLNNLGKESANYMTLWDEEKSIEEKIFNKEKELLYYNTKQNLYHISLSLHDEATTPQNTVSFVNMPGFEYSFYKIETPKQGLSADSYNGYFLKYLFTRGKSYALVGIYKANNLSAKDSTTLSDLLLVGFGQDFYSRYLGRGTKRFLNLYSSYTIGGIFGTSKTDYKSDMFFVTPSIGLEIFKNKYMLLDTKVGYLIPFGNNSKHMRGLEANVSLNFVF